MNRFFTKSIALIALVGAFTLGSATKSEAAFRAWICNDVNCVGGGDIIVDDGGAGDGFAATPGAILATAANFDGDGAGTDLLSVVLNLSQSKPVLVQPSMDLNFAVTGIGQVWLYATDTDFTAVTPFSGSLNGNFSGTGSVEGVLYGGFDNISGTRTGGGTSTGVLGSPFAGTISKAAATANPYALTLLVHVIRTSAGTTTGDFLIVPEPAVMSLLGLGLAGLAARRRRVNG